MNMILCLWFSTLIICVNCDLIKLKSGVINGTVGKTKNGRLIRTFYSIPYAEPPVGMLRLKPPIAAKSWSGVKDATKYPPKCIQSTISIPSAPATNIQEDCLYLNVFVPNDLFKPSSGKAPVMVWIHGGSFLFGSSSGYNPEYFMDKDVIFVTINYRLGALGFFGMNDDVISGNFGLKDQVLALQWVKENIGAFGGDPDRVTLIGESAGAASVHLHMFSPLSKGLFQKAIMQSGSAFSSWASLDSRSGEAFSTAFLVISGCFRNDSARILKCLQYLPLHDFLTLCSRLYPRNLVEATVSFKPIVESNVKNQPFLPQKPEESTYQSNVPWITGINSGEGALGVAKLLAEGGILENVTNVQPLTLIPILWPYLYSLDPEYIQSKAQKIVDFYFGSKNVGKSNALKFVDIFTDSAFLHPFINTVQSGHNEQYVYYYDHKGSFSWVDKTKLDIDLGVSHADELPLLFRSKILEAKRTPQDNVVSEMLIKFWTEFAITSDPNGKSKEKLWKPTSSKGDIEYLHIKSNCIMMETNLLKDRYEFWESLFRDGVSQ